MKEVDWSNFSGKKGGKGNGIQFLRFERDTTYKVRPFGGALEFYKLFIEKGKPSILVDPDDAPKAAKILSEATGRDIRPSYRNAMFVIDRSDGKIRILEGGFQIFEQFASWSANSGVKPGSGNAGDWAIVVTGEGVGTNGRKYVCNFMGNSPFSDEEKALISTLKEDDKLKLANYLKEVPLEDVLKVAGLAEEETATATAATPSSGDDDMDW